MGAGGVASGPDAQGLLGQGLQVLGLVPQSLCWAFGGLLCRYV